MPIQHQQKIPTGWREITLNSVSDKIGDGLHSTPKYTENTSYFFINGNNIDNGKVVINSNTKSVDKGEYYKYKIDLNEKSLFLSINGTIGNVAYYGGESVILGKSAAYINCSTSVSEKFIFNFLNTIRAKRYFISELSGSTISNLSLKSIRNTKLFIPPTIEQTRIVQVLETWDKYLEYLDKKIKIKENVKKGLAQNLLSNKKNLVEWKNNLIKDICTIGDGNCSAEYPKNEEMVDIGIPFIRGSNFINGNISMKDMKFITIEKHQKLKKGHVYENDILMVNRGEIGKTAMVTSEFNNSNLNSQLVWLRTKEKVNHLFLFYVLNLNRTLQKLKRHQSGGALQQLTIKEIRKFCILLPSISEQERIANILMTADREIEELEKQTRLVINQKKYLLNNLITGRIRLPEFVKN